jgi:hypothetical protein
MSKTMFVSHLTSSIGAKHMVLHPLPMSSGGLDPLDVYRGLPCPAPVFGIVYPGAPATAKLYLCAEEYDKLKHALEGGDAYIVLDCLDSDEYPVSIVGYRLFAWNAITGDLAPFLAPVVVELIKQIGHLEHQITAAREQLVPKVAELTKLLDTLFHRDELPNVKAGP